MGFLRAFFLVFLTCILGSSTVRAETRGIQDEANRLVMKFEKAISRASIWPLALDAEKRPQVNKQAGALSVTLRSDLGVEGFHYTFRSWLVDLLYVKLPTMGKYMGIPISTLPGDTPNSNIEIWIGSPETIAEWLSHRHDDAIARRAVRNTACGVDIRDSTRSTKIVIRHDTSPAVMRHCTLAGILAAFGLPGLMSEAQTSLTEIKGEPVDTFNNDIRVLLRVLYDARMRNGMTVEQAVAQARNIVPGLLKLVDTEGYPALFQIRAAPNRAVR